MTTWIFLRGLMRESRHWGSFPVQFREELNPVRIVQPDLPGNGPLNKLTSPARVENMVDSYRNTMRTMGFAPPYSLLGLSMGAMTAAAWAHRYPSELGACVLINTSMRPFSPFYHRLDWRNYPDLCRLLLSPDISRREHLILRLTSARPEVRDRVLSQWIEYQRQYPVSRHNGLAQLAAAARYCAPASKPEVPLLILASKGDRLVNPLCSVRLARAWQADLSMHADAGHDLPLDDGPWVARQVCAWLQRPSHCNDHVALGWQDRRHE